MRKIILLCAVLAFLVAGAIVLGKGRDKINCCFRTKSGRLKCMETTRPECKNAGGRVVNTCAQCK
jgi:hypothetical protein